MVGEYIQAHLKNAAAKQDIFTDKALDEIIVQLVQPEQSIKFALTHGCTPHNG